MNKLLKAMTRDALIGMLEQETERAGRANEVTMDTLNRYNVLVVIAKDLIGLACPLCGAFGLPPDGDGIHFIFTADASGDLVRGVAVGTCRLTRDMAARIKALDRPV